MQVKNINVKYIDLAEKYFEDIVQLTEERLVSKYITVEKLKDFVKNKNNASKLVVDAKTDRMLGFLLAHGLDISSLSEQLKLTPDEIKNVVKNNEKVYMLKTLALQKDAEKHGFATALIKQSLETAKKWGFHSAWSALWVRKDGNIPAKKLIERAGFSFYKIVHMRMYNRSDFECKDCKGHCTCDDAIFYKIL